MLSNLGREYLLVGFTTSSFVDLFILSILLLLRDKKELFITNEI